jgi:hypothetical protein
MSEVYGRELLSSCLLYPLKEIKIQSFIFNGVKDEVHSIYLNFDKWISLFYDCGALFIKEGYNEKQQRIESQGNTIEFQFIDLKIYALDFNLILNKKLTAFSISENSELILLFENNIELLIAQPNHILDGPTTIDLNKGKIEQDTIL